QHTRSILSSV
ncbi:cysteine--tRNA ligase, partial [Vibrio parahaemolyticus VPTS-2010]